jgi:hypothetical protein
MLLLPSYMPVVPVVDVITISSRDHTSWLVPVLTPAGALAGQPLRFRKTSATL